MRNPIDLFQRLLVAESEEEVTRILVDHDLLHDRLWLPVGGKRNNVGAILNQQSDGTAALIEKLINSIDAMLMLSCYQHGINPKSQDAPPNMSDALDRFFGIPQGKLSLLEEADRRRLADNIHLVATGPKGHPNYLIIDRGEGQTPARFADTFLSLHETNKTDVPFVQGKFNMGGTGVLNFCGKEKYQLIVSRRAPGIPFKGGDETAGQWGFTLVRRTFPERGRQIPCFVYLAPDGQMPSFEAESIQVLPAPSLGEDRPGKPYSLPLEYGTCIKLYNYQMMSGKGRLTSHGKIMLQRFLPLCALPIRLHETRNYAGYALDTTFVGGWIEATDKAEAKLESDPVSGTFIIEGLGLFRYDIAIFKPEANAAMGSVALTINGQSHLDFDESFIERTLHFDWLKKSLYVNIDCTQMADKAQFEVFMASRDRHYESDAYELVRKQIVSVLRDQPLLAQLNYKREQEHLRDLTHTATHATFQELIDHNPDIAELFSREKPDLRSSVDLKGPVFVGRRFPTYFRLAKNPIGGLVVHGESGKILSVAFETDAENGYFSRDIDPGRFEVSSLFVGESLTNGRWILKLQIPVDAYVGDSYPITVTVIDDLHIVNPFVASFVIGVIVSSDASKQSGSKQHPDKASTSGKHDRDFVMPPEPGEVYKAGWDEYNFDEYSAICIRNLSTGPGYTFWVNMDNKYFVRALKNAHVEQREGLINQFKYGLVLSAIGVIKSQMRQGTELDLQQIGSMLEGEALVLLPMISALGALTKAVNQY